MRSLALPLAAAIAAVAVPQLALADNEVVANRNPLPLGESVTLRWYFTGNKVVVSGGRFGKGVVVTGRTSLTDHPAQTTRYTFDVDFAGKPAGAPTAQPNATDAKPSVGADAKTVPLHARYSVVVEVYDPRAVGLKPYVDPHGWEVSVLNGWKRDAVNLPDPANNALMYFQQEDDSVERLAIAILPVSEMSIDALMDKIQADLPSHYDQVQLVSRTSDLCEGQPAVIATFTGMDNSHPGTKTTTLFLAFTRGRHAYVVSARTAADRFAQRKRLLTYMVRSFAFCEPRPSHSTVAAKATSQR